MRSESLIRGKPLPFLANCNYGDGEQGPVSYGLLVPHRILVMRPKQAIWAVFEEYGSGHVVSCHVGKVQNAVQGTHLP